MYLDDKGNKALSLVSVRPQKNIAILKFAEINSIEQAQEMKNKILYCNRDDAEIGEDTYYLADIIGCRVIDADSGEDYGEVKDVMNYGSCDIYDVVKDKKHYLIPATPDIIAELDLDSQVIKIHAMKGLFNEN